MSYLKVSWVYMNKIEFDINWLEQKEAVNDPNSFTWAQLTITVGDEVISEHNNWLTFSTDDRIVLPLYPLAEWLVLNWWNLLYEPFTPNQQIRDSLTYFSRHNLKYARSGFSLPDLIIQPQGATTLLHWKAATLKNHKCRFLNDGYTFVDSLQFEENITGFILAVIDRLEKKGVKDTLLQTEWDSIENINEEERQFCQAAAQAGMDPFNCSEEDADLILLANESLPSSILKEFYCASNSTKLKGDIANVKHAIEVAKKNQNKFEFLKSIKHKLSYSNNNSMPWREGYQAALEVREKLNLNGTAVTTIDKLSEYLKLDVNELSQKLDKDFSSSIRLIGGTNQTHDPVFVFSKNSPNSEKSKKFNVARGLYEYFYGEDFSLISDVYDENQKRNRAFAAEFLLPSLLLRKRINTEYVSYDQINDLAEEFNISSMVVELQLKNHNIATVNSDYLLF
jgi:Zn-dependent peptidase ImmA (M78 family)